MPITSDERVVGVPLDGTGQAPRPRARPSPRCILVRLGLTACLAATLVLPGLAVADSDYQQGLAAFDQGDHERALELWRPLAEAGHREAQFGLALLCEGGLGMPRDEEQALHWYRRAARQGLPAAQNNLAAIYAAGRGVPADRELALWLWRDAAAAGHKAARANLTAALAREVGGKHKTPTPHSTPVMPADPGSTAVLSAQLGSLGSSERAEVAARELSERYRDLLGDRTVDIQRADLGARGVWYRLMVGPIDARQAHQLCEGVRARSAPDACVLVAE